MRYDQKLYEIALLLSKFARGVLTAEEQIQFENWLNESPDHRKLAGRVKDSDTLKEAYELLSSLDTNDAWDKIVRKAEASPATEDEPVVTPTRKRFWWYAAAAVAMVAVVKFVPWESLPDRRANERLSAASVLDAVPQEITLVLSDGTKYQLSRLPEGDIRLSDGTTLFKTDQSIRYQHSPRTENIHTLYTPIGERYRVYLPDGTSVWLNAASSLRYHTPQDGERNVILNGEAYFEVTSKSSGKGVKVPFRVHTEKAVIEVTGTEFNVHSYEGSPLQATLVEGSGSLKTKQEEIVLRPGQQGLVDGEISVEQVDTDEIRAWKEGLFQFENKPLDYILTELQRWYGFELDPDARIPSKRFTASISRDQSLEAVLRMLELSGEVSFELNGQTLRIKQPKSISQPKKPMIENLQSKS